MKTTEYLAWLRYCCATLANTDSDCKSFTFALQQTKEALDELRPQPYVGSTCGLPPVMIFSLLEKFKQLENEQIAVEEFCAHFKVVIEALERNNDEKVALATFSSALAELLLSLQYGKEETAATLQKLQKLSEAFSKLPSKEKERLLSKK